MNDKMFFVYRWGAWRWMVQQEGCVPYERASFGTFEEAIESVQNSTGLVFMLPLVPMQGL